MNSNSIDLLATTMATVDDETLGWVFAYALANRGFTDSVGGMEWTHRVRQAGGLQPLLEDFANALREAADHLQWNPRVRSTAIAERFLQALNAARTEEALADLVYGTPLGDLVDRDASHYVGRDRLRRLNLPVPDSMLRPPTRLVLLSGDVFEREDEGMPWSLLAPDAAESHRSDRVS